MATAIISAWERKLISNLLLGSAFAALSFFTPATVQHSWTFDPSQMHPFGTRNPLQSDEEARIFDPFIGGHDCTQERLDATSGKMVSGVGTWIWRYDMNGFGVRDDYRFNSGAPASLRIYDRDAKLWHVWYFLGQDNYYAGEWVGGREGDMLVFRQTIQTSMGTVTVSRLEFYEIGSDEFKWRSVNLDADTGEEVVDWRIKCARSTLG